MCELLHALFEGLYFKKVLASHVKQAIDPLEHILVDHLEAFLVVLLDWIEQYFHGFHYFVFEGEPVDVVADF